ncbi:homeobox protein 4 [Colias croceus]|uniref:homeobox protein 4 n=1 Tax=Colias crocea TaxID=72248 RepID=UPI001E27CF49|nr:homeobox protein 4 [Colias croceus]
MLTVKILTIFLVYILKTNVHALSFPGPRVYVVTPSPRPFQVNSANSAPFYYHNWMRRMDSEEHNATTTTTTTTTPKVETPDLIFAEFESDGSMKKSIKKLLEKERIAPSTSTTQQPIYVPDEETERVTRIVNYGLPVTKLEEKNATPKPKNNNNNYFSLDENFYNEASVPEYMPTTKRPITESTTTSTTTTTSSPINVENIWHIIDNEKFNQHSGDWDEVFVDTSNNANENEPEKSDNHNEKENDDSNIDNNEEVKIDDNFALPGFATNPGSGAENESRAIRTEQNIRFPYINLKPFQMKSLKKPILDVLSNSKKGNNLYSNLDNFFDLKNPVRGEAQDIGSVTMNQPVPNNQPVDRYNPAQPYFPAYGSKASKPAPPVYSPPKATANLIPPPPPPPPKGNDFPTPTIYESFPPYAPSGPDFDAPSPPAKIPASPPAPVPSLPIDTPPSDSIDSYSGPSSNDGPSMDLGYRYKPPSAPSPPQFLPTIAPESKPFKGYSYDRPPMPSNDAPMSMDDMPDFQGYDYSKPSSGPQAPTKEYDSPPSYGSSDSGPSYGHDDAPPEHHESDYPELIFNKHHGHMGDDSGGDVKGAGMMPPPDMKPDSYGPPSDFHGFPSDFPGDFKLHHDFDDHDHDYHHHHHHPEPSTTEMPRVNRFSYYYLGKKLYYLPLYFSAYFIVYVGALVIKAVLRHKIVYPNSWRPNDTTASFFSKRSVDEFLSNENLHEMAGKVTHAIATAAEKYMNTKKKLE